MHEKPSKALILASASPRRYELLMQLGFNPTVRIADIDESPRAAETPVDLVLRLAESKASSVARILSRDIASAGSGTVLAADTMISLDSRALGKPADKQACIEMLSALSGRQHEVISGVCVLMDDQLLSTTVTTVVQMGVISKIDAERYWNTGEPCDKAGSYAIQGQGAIFVERIDGSYSNVVGLPLFETAQLLEQTGLRVI